MIIVQPLLADYLFQKNIDKSGFNLDKFDFAPFINEPTGENEEDPCRSNLTPVCPKIPNFPKNFQKKVKKL